MMASIATRFMLHGASWITAAAFAAACLKAYQDPVLMLAFITTGLGCL